jgi:hypothetical protein
MPDYRRNWVPGGNFFFTVNLLDPTSTVLKKMVAEIRGIARGTTGRIVMWC